MSLRQLRALKIVAAFLIFATAQVSFQISMANPTTAAGPLPQQFIARLTTRANQPIVVNGNNAATGASILTGALIETDADTGATINLGPLGTLDVAPNTRLRLDYDENGNVKVLLIVGCAILTMRRNTNGEVETEQGPAAKTDRAQGGFVDICFPPGATAPTINQGAASAAGAGAGTTAAAGTGINKVLLFSLIGAGVGIVLPVALIGDNPSPSTPSSSFSG